MTFLLIRIEADEREALADMLKGPACYKQNNPLVRSLLRRGLVRRNAAALKPKARMAWYRITPAGREALKGHP